MRVLLAYLDPGSGSIIWQAIVGGLLGSAFVLRNTATRIVQAGRSAFSNFGHHSDKKIDNDTKQ